VRVYELGVCIASTIMGNGRANASDKRTNWQLAI